MTSPPPPARRFKPEPVESSVRSSKRPQQLSDKANESTQVTSASHDSRPSQNSNDMAPHSKPRRFLPQPVEESARTSRKKKPVELEQTNLEDSAPPDSDNPTVQGVPSTKPPTSGVRFAPEPVETTSRSSRRKFAPEPVESSSRSSKDKGESTRPRRRFAPEPVEESTRSSKDKNQADTSAKPRRKFAPEPVETQSISRRRKAPEKVEQYDFAAEDGPAASSSPPSRGSSGGRKFSPELIETAKGKYRHSIVKPPVRQKPPSPPPEEETDEVAPIEESKFSAANLAKKHHEDKRKGSLMVPDLPTIESDSGDDSEAPSLTNSRSSAESEQRQNSRRAAGDSYTDYVLRLAAQNSTEKELQSQAMAAYINERVHEPVAHFAFDDEDDGPIRVGKLSGQKGVDIRTFRRSSQDDLDWEMQNMRKHHEQLEQAKKDFKHDTAGQSRFSAAALGMRHHMEEQKEKKAKKPKPGEDEQSELAKMRAAASPPMLGTDLVFPYTISPKMTRCDTDHAPRPRTNDSDDEVEEEGDQNLWNTKVHVQKEATAGLWGGMCQRGENDGRSSRPQTPTRSGIQTPAVERGNPFESSTPGRGQRTPGRRKQLNFLALTSTTTTMTNGEDVFTSAIDKKLMLEKQIEEEFPDRVVTQIYNYLSLGYPSLAWAFDEELAKISRIPMEDLRKDDEQMDAKGYVGVPEGTGCEEVDVVGGKCRRWEALRLYVREWARQSPNFMSEGERMKGGRGEAWGGGAAVRKGSWGH